MMAEIEAKQREVERIKAEEAKTNLIPFIKVLEEEIEDSVETNRIQAVLMEAQAAYSGWNGSRPATTKEISAAHARAAAAARAKAIERREYIAHGTADASTCNEVRLEAEFQEALAQHYKRADEMLSKKESCLLLRAQLDAAKKDAEWKIQSFKIIDALTQRVAALEARLDAKETPVLGSDPDSGEDSVEDFCYRSSSHETTRRTLFPYW